MVSCHLKYFKKQTKMPEQNKTTLTCTEDTYNLVVSLPTDSLYTIIPKAYFLKPNILPFPLL